MEEDDQIIQQPWDFETSLIHEMAPKSEQLRRFFGIEDEPDEVIEDVLDAEFIG